MTRDPRFATVTDTDLNFFESVLGAGGVVTDPHDLQPFNRRALWAVRNRSRAVDSLSTLWIARHDLR